MRPKQSSLKTADTSNFDINLSRSSTPDSSFFALRLVGRPGVLSLLAPDVPGRNIRELKQALHPWRSHNCQITDTTNVECMPRE